MLQDPLRYGIHCWVLHPEYNNEVIGEAKSGVNNRSRSHNTHLVAACKDGQQFILFKKVFRHDIPLLFPHDPNVGTVKMCDDVLWAPGKTERWVRWSSRFLREKTDVRPIL